MIRRALPILLLCAYLAMAGPFAVYMKDRPVIVKLGYLPDASVLKGISGEYGNMVSAFSVVKVLFYFGTLFEKFNQQILVPPDYYNMFKTLEKAVLLDPYNMDAYYFMQSAFTWEVGHASDVNRVLEYGMKYRAWDYQLPFFAGFNSAYFLKDYSTAAAYMKRAAELSGNPLFTKLSARYFYEAGRTDLGLLFLNNMIKKEKDKQVRAVYETRKKALIGVREITAAVSRFRERNNRLPEDLRELTATGFLERIPSDPYGGIFYLDEKGIVRSTSKFAFASKNKKSVSSPEMN